MAECWGFVVDLVAELRALVVELVAEMVVVVAVVEHHVRFRYPKEPKLQKTRQS